MFGFPLPGPRRRSPPVNSADAFTAQRKLPIALLSRPVLLALAFRSVFVG